jgi:hypothetical protein
MAKNVKQSRVSWYARIFGNESELKKLRDLLDSPECRLLLFKPPNEGCYLTSCSFSKLTDQEAVLESAKKLVTLIRAFAKLELGGDFQSINVGTGKTTVDVGTTPFLIKCVGGKPDGVFAFCKTAHMSFSANVAKVIVTDKDGNVVQEEPPKREKRVHDDYLNRCDEEIDSNVFDTLYYFAEETSFYSLYKVYETIKEDTDGHPKIDQNCKMVADGWVDYKDLKAFKESANCYGIVRSPEGKYSLRHSPAKCRQGKQYQGAIFDLSQCLDFIKRLLERWLSWKS